MFTGQGLVARDPGAVEIIEKEAREHARVNLVGSQARDGTDRIVVSELHVWQLRIPIVLAVVDDQNQHLRYRLVNALHTTVNAWMVGAGGDFSNNKKLIYDVGKLGAELRAVAREDASWTPPKELYRFIRILAVPSAVILAAVTTNMSARRQRRAIAMAQYSPRLPQCPASEEGESKRRDIKPSVAVSSALGT